MTIAHKLPAKNKHKCDICGKVDFWDEMWSSYNSMAMEEACPEDIPATCSEKCKKELSHRLRTGEIRPPKLRKTPYGFSVTEERKGY